MKSVLFQFGPVTIYSYGTVLALSFILGLLLIIRRGSRVGISRETCYDMGLWMIVGGLLGARLAYVALHAAEFGDNPLEVFMIHRGGLAFYGSFLGGAAALWVFVKRRKLPFFRVGDAMAPVIAFCHAIGRIGCFLNGCCFGRLAGSACGVTFPADSPPGRHFGAYHVIHPTQLYESASLIVLAVVLILSDGRKRFEGQTTAMYVVLYSVIRFSLEFYRGDHDKTFLGALTSYQIMSIALCAAGIIAWIALRRGVKAQGRE